jgi:Raf kinase inhibitor-like YbhB/YbcL family protein
MKRNFLGVGLGLGLALVGCDPGDNLRPDATSGIEFTLTSSAFASNRAIAADNTCSGVNMSPPLTWIGAPSGARSFAVVVTDLSLAPRRIHWVIYDIPATATGLPAHVETVYAPSNVPGAHQTASYNGHSLGYLGPCPQAFEENTYQFALYALLTPTLPDATMQTTAAQAITSIMADQLASTTLISTYYPNP